MFIEGGQNWHEAQKTPEELLQDEALQVIADLKSPYITVEIDDKNWIIITIDAKEDDGALRDVIMEKMKEISYAQYDFKKEIN